MRAARVPRRCTECGSRRLMAGQASVIVGCRACCRDCGFPCAAPKDDEGFHFVEIDEEYLEARRLEEDHDVERVVYTRRAS